MGVCISKPVMVYQSILEECYDLLNVQKVSDQDSKRIRQNSVQRRRPSRFLEMSSERMENQTEFTQEVRDKAELSIRAFLRRDVSKLEGHVKQQAKILSDHIQDTNVRLIDSVVYLRDQITLHPTNYGIQWVTLLILEVLVKNLRHYSQKHISFRLLHGEDSKFENQTEIHESKSNNNLSQQTNENIGIKEESNDNNQITFFSDNFIRFEIEFIEIALYILNEKANPFFSHSQNLFLTILFQFSQLHQDPYSSDRVFNLSDQLELDIENLTNQILKQEDNSPEKTQSICNFDDKKTDTLCSLMNTYAITLSKIKTNQNVFRLNKQLNFFFFTLQTIIQFNTLANQTKDAQILSIADHVTRCSLDIISVFANRAFALKNYQALLSNLFAFFDYSKWDPALNIETIINQTLIVASRLSLEFNYRVYLLEHLIDYLQLLKHTPSPIYSYYYQVSQPLIPKSQKIMHIDREQNTRKSSIKQVKETEIIRIPQRMENFTDPQVKIRALRLFDMLVGQKDKEVPILLHSKNRIVKCYLDNLKQFSDIEEVKVALQESFVHYTLSFAPDSSTFMSLLIAMSKEICEYFIGANLENVQILPTPRNKQMTPRHKLTQIQLISPFKEVQGLNMRQHSQSNIVYGQQLQYTSSPSQLQGEQQEQLNMDSMKHISESLHLMTLGLECSSSFVSAPVITDEVIINLIFLSNLKAVSLNSFEVLTKLVLLRMKQEQPASITLSQAIGNQISQMSPLSSCSSLYNQISTNSLLHVLYQSLKYVYHLNLVQDIQSIYTSVVISHFTSRIIEDILKHNNIFHIRAIFAYTVRLAKEFSHSKEVKEMKECKQMKEQSEWNEQLIKMQLNSQQQNSLYKKISQVALIRLLLCWENLIPASNFGVNVSSRQLQDMVDWCSELFNLHENMTSAESSKLKLTNIMGNHDDIDIRIQLICQRIVESPPLILEALSNESILTKFVSLASVKGYNSDSDFDSLTEQFQNNFAKTVGDFDFNFHIDDDFSITKGNRNSIMHVANNINTNESLAYEKDDEHFENILNMIQIHNLPHHRSPEDNARQNCSNVNIPFPSLSAIDQIASEATLPLPQPTLPHNNQLDTIDDVLQ